jgi:phytoene dehydrogenase-like protein
MPVARRSRPATSKVLLYFSMVLLPALADALPKGAPTGSAYARALSAYARVYGKSKPNTFYYRDSAYLAKTFKELSRIYSDETAVRMVEAVPGALTFKPANFQPTLDIFAEQFGEEPARAMIIRNPALLSTPPDGPDGAANAAPTVMAVSYIVAATRPIGGVLIVLLFLLLGSGGAGVPGSP